MGQVLHGSAKTTHAVRAELQRSQAGETLRVTRDERLGLRPPMLRWPEGRSTLRASTHDKSFIEICSAFELACQSAEFWEHSELPQAAAHARGETFRGNAPDC